MKLKTVILASLFILSSAKGQTKKELPDSPIPKVLDSEIAYPELKGKYNPIPYMPKYAAYKPVDKTFWLWTAAMSSSSVYLYRAGINCRNRNGVEPCWEHYGSFDAMAGLQMGLSSIVFPATFYGCRKNTENSKWCNILPLGLISFNIGFGIRQQITNQKEIH